MLGKGCVDCDAEGLHSFVLVGLGCEWGYRGRGVGSRRPPELAQL